MKNITTSVLAAGLLLLNFNTNAQFGSMKGKKDKSDGTNRIYNSKDKDNYTPNQGTKTELHKKYENKIVLSKKPLAEGETSEASISNSFSIGEPIYGRVFLQTCLLNFAYVDKVTGENKKSTQGDFYTLVYVDDKLIEYQIHQGCSDESYHDFKNKFSFSVVLVGAAGSNEAIKYNSAHSLTDELVKLSSGSHIIRMEMFKGEIGFSSPQPIATGEFTFVKKEGAEYKIGKTFNELGEKISDPQLEKECLEKFTVLAKKAKDEGIVSGVRALTNWGVAKNDLGVSLYRDRKIAILLKTPDGRCVFSTSRITQNANNGGWDREIIVNNGDFGAFDQKLDCK